MSFYNRERGTLYCLIRSPYHRTSSLAISSVPRRITVRKANWKSQRPRNKIFIWGACRGISYKLFIPHKVTNHNFKVCPKTTCVLDMKQTYMHFRSACLLLCMHKEPGLKMNRDIKYNQSTESADFDKLDGWIVNRGRYFDIKQTWSAWVFFQILIGSNKNILMDKCTFHVLATELGIKIDMWRNEAAPCNEYS